MMRTDLTWLPSDKSPTTPLDVKVSLLASSSRCLIEFLAGPNRVVIETNGLGLKTLAEAIRAFPASAREALAADHDRQAKLLAERIGLLEECVRETA